LKGEGASAAGRSCERLRGPKTFDEIAFGEFALGKGADVDGEAVHGNAPDDGQPYAAVPQGPRAAEGARPAVGIAQRDRCKPLRRGGDMVQAIADPGSRRDGADLEHPGVKLDDGAQPYRVGPRIDPEQCDARTREIRVEGWGEKDAAAVGDRRGDTREMRCNPAKGSKLLPIRSAVWLVGAGKMRHQQPEVEFAGARGVGGERERILHREAEARHAAVDL